MTATLCMVPLARIRPSKANPRADFDDERMAELVASVKLHGIITPLTLSHDGDGRYAIIAGERRYRAAKAAKLREVPAQVREVDGEALTLAVAENVIRADLTPVEEAEAYRRLVEEHGDAAKVAKLVGRSERLIGERLELLRLPEEARALVAARKVPLLHQLSGWAIDQGVSLDELEVSKPSLEDIYLSLTRDRRGDSDQPAQREQQDGRHS